MIPQPTRKRKPVMGVLEKQKPLPFNSLNRDCRILPKNKADVSLLNKERKAKSRNLYLGRYPPHHHI